MATATRRAKLRVRKQPTTNTGTIQDNYRRVRAVVLLCMFTVLFGVLWIVNGDWTASLLISAFGVSAAMGWAIHLIVSSTELAGPILRPYMVDLPAWLPAMIILISLPFGVLDVLSSAVGIAEYLHWTRLTGIQFDTLSTAIGLFVAFMPERMIFFLIAALMAVLRR